MKLNEAATAVNIMSCTSPRTVWWSKDLNEHCNKYIVFCSSKSDGEPPFLLPCGQCASCRIDHSKGWRVRLINESKFHLLSSFLNLTYSNEHLPPGRTLVKRDVQLFMKRLRKHYSGIKIRYFAVGEYGETTFRPHYHVILFGLAFLEDRRPHSKNPQGDQMYTSETLTKLWGKGHAIIGNVSPRSCGYVAEYSYKKINGKPADDHYRVIDKATGETFLRQKEFALMSLHPGLGSGYYERYHDQMYMRGSVIVSGKELPIPKYYDRLLKRDDPLRLESIKTGRFEDAQRHADEQTPERLAVKAELVLAKRKEHLNRKL